MNEEKNTFGEVIFAYTVEQAIADGALKEEPVTWNPTAPGQRFALGRILMTPGALAAFEDNEMTAEPYLKRHVSGDWGDLEEEDRQENELSVKEGYRILSAYHLPAGQKVYVITEADRSVTTVLLPSEY